MQQLSNQIYDVVYAVDFDDVIDEHDNLTSNAWAQVADVVSIAVERNEDETFDD